MLGKGIIKWRGIFGEHPYGVGYIALVNVAYWQKKNPIDIDSCMSPLLCECT